MDFLREAVLRSRRILQWRELLLMALRTFGLLLFGLAMARPYLSGQEAAATNPDQPVHAVLLVDNSLSMSYQKLDGTLLDDAKAKGREVIERLPRGSRISVLPICGSATAFSYDPYYTPADALEALGAIKPVDRAATPQQTVDLALEACRRLPTMSAKQLVLLTDRHGASWPTRSLAEQGKQLPAAIRVVEVAADGMENAWIADFKLRDGVADLQTPVVFVATIGYQGRSPRHDVQVTLTVDGVTIAAQSVDLQPGQRREIRFPPYRFDVPVEPGKPTFVAAEVSLSPDRLPTDDRRFLVVPVLAALPVVFVDQWGRDEVPRLNRYGETFYLRRLLAPVTSRVQRERRLIEVRHVKIDELKRELLEDARLVVIAGISGPGSSVPLLREYVEQGGNLVIAAGGEFDPRLWTEAAWQEGGGILPAPLAPTAVGRLPAESPEAVKPFQIDFDSLVHSYFFLDDVSREELQDLYRLPYFFRAVAADVSEKSRSRVMARFTNGLPFLIDRRLGRGQVLLVCTGVSSQWNTLPLTNTMLVFDRILRGMFQDTLPPRNMDTQERLVLPVAAADRHAQVALIDPAGHEEPLTVDVLGTEHYGVTIADRTQRGLYHVVAMPNKDPSREATGSKLWDVLLAVNGPAEESELAAEEKAAPGQAEASSALRGAAQATSAASRPIEPEQELWKWGLLAVLGCLLAELALLAWPSLREGRPI